MKVSPETTALIQELIEPLTWRERITGSRNYASILTKIGDSNEPGAIAYLLPFTIASDRNVAAAAARAVHKLASVIDATEINQLAPSLHYGPTYSLESHNWYHLCRSKFAVFEDFGDAATSLFALASFHHNGYVRETAIEKLSLIKTGFEVPFLILRLNDWVPEVRDAAYHEIRSRLTPEYCRHLIANLPLIGRLKHAGRVDHTPLINAVHELLQSDECRSVLFESLKSTDRQIRRACFKLAMDAPHSNLQQILTLALADNDTVIRQRAAQKISATLEPEIVELFLDRLKHDRLMTVRREALRIAVKTNAPDVVEQLHTGLLDPHTSIREECRYHLRKVAPMDVAAFYREHLEAGRELYSAISGLGETGRSDDDRLIVPYASHQTSKIRRSAIKALATLNAKAHLDLFMNALEDEVPAISHHALRALSRHTSMLRASRVWALFVSTPRPHVKRNALLLIEKFSKWESISYLVRALGETDEDIVDRSGRAVRDWPGSFNRDFSTPSSEQLARFRDALKKYGELIDEQTRALLWFSIKGLG